MKNLVSVACRALAIVSLLPFWAWADALTNPEFETGDLTGWTIRADQMGIGSSTNTTFNRNYSGQIQGTYSGNAWITNTLSQTIAVAAGDDIDATGFVRWDHYSEQTAPADGFLEVALDGPFGRRSTIWTNTHDQWTFVQLTGAIFGASAGGFESGTLAGWDMYAESVGVEVTTNKASKGDYATRMSGSWSNWGFNRVYQSFHAVAGETITVRGNVLIDDLQTVGTNNPWVLAGLKVEEIAGPDYAEALLDPTTPQGAWLDVGFSMLITNTGQYLIECVVMGGTDASSSADVYFDEIVLQKEGGVPGYVALTFGNNDGSDVEFIQHGSNFPSSSIDLGAIAASNIPKELNTSWYPSFYFHNTFDAEQAAKNFVCTLDPAWNSGGGTLTVALDKWAGAVTSWIEQGQADISSAQIGQIVTPSSELNLGNNEFRLRAVGGSAGTDTVTWDQLRFESEGIEHPVFSLTLSIDYHGHSGGPAFTSDADVYADGFTILGSTALIRSPTNILTKLSAEAQSIAMDPGTPIPELVYPWFFELGYPDGSTVSNLNYPSYVETVTEGWRFRWLSNDVPLMVTNVITLREVKGEGPGYFEFDEYRYLDKFWHTERGAPIDINTNTPYFTIGTRDNSGAEFGNGPFPAVHTYTLGDPLSNFPRILNTDASGGWPKELRIVWPENLSQHELSRDKHFTLATVTTNGPDSNIKVARIEMHVRDPLVHTNVVAKSQEIHMGWAEQTSSLGKVDFPNLTFQDHNLVGVRSGGRYALADDGNWFVQQSPRGTAVIEPMTLHTFKNGSWIQRIYEEYLYMWPNAGSGVRSIFDTDDQIHLDGRVCYDISFKIGHTYGTNDFGDINFVQLFEGRGNAYYRMTDYGGVLGGSFRPVAANLFSLHRSEDNFMMPEAYTHVVPRTTPANEMDNSYAQVFTMARSRTNQQFISTMQTDFHFTPQETRGQGAWFDMAVDTWVNSDLIVQQHGRFSLFAQSQLHWRGDTNYSIDGFTEAHDLDAVMVQKADGEWISHQVLNPPTNVYQRTLSNFELGDIVHIHQQDRGELSYGFTPEAPYQRVAQFEITLLEEPGKDITLDVYEEHTVFEFNDNVVVSCVVNEDLDQGEHLAYKYRYRAVYSPGVTIVSPNDPAGGDGWSNTTYTIEFNATDGDVTLGETNTLMVNLFYGNGKDDDWTLMNTNDWILVPSTNPTARFAWDTANVPPGAYYIKATAQRNPIDREGFDVSNARLQVGGIRGFARNGLANIVPVTNGTAFPGNDLDFESGSTAAWNTSPTEWATGLDDLPAGLVTDPVYQGTHAARMAGSWTGWSWNALSQEILVEEGDELVVSGRIFVGALQEGSTNKIACGIKMESAVTPVTIDDGVEFTTSVQTGTWIDVSFTHRPPRTGYDKLFLWVAGFDGAMADVYFDDIKVMRSKIIQVEHWSDAGGTDVTGDSHLSFWVAGTNPATQTLSLWVADGSGTTNTLVVTNYLDHMLTFAQRVDVPWSDLAGLDLTDVRAIGYTPNDPEQTDVSVTGVRTINDPLHISSSLSGAPAVDLKGMPLINPGETITNVLTLANPSGTAMTGLYVQVLQEYGEIKMWHDTSDHGESLWSAMTRKGARLVENYEQAWTNQSIPAGGSLTLTNVYESPIGFHVQTTNPVGVIVRDFYIRRNYESRAQTHVVVREANGDNLFTHDQVAVYAMDNDFDIDNDGLTDDWETLHFGDRTIADPNVDSDGDLFSNLDEHNAGTDPNDPGSFPAGDVTLVIAGSPGAYGTPAPRDYGTHLVLSNSTIINTVDALVQEALDIRHWSGGWTGTGNVPASGGSTQVVFTVTTNSMLTWLWNTEYALNQSLQIMGTLTGSVASTEQTLDRTLGIWGDYGSDLDVDGSYAAIGVDGPEGAYVFRKAGSSWVEHTKLVGNDGSFGDKLPSVGIAGPYVIAGSPADDDNGSDSGSAYIFERSGVVWTQAAKLTGSQTVAADEFGWAVDIDADYVLVGAPGPFHGGHPGAAYIFHRSGSSWTEQAILSASDGVPLNEFGAAVAIDDELAVVGAYADDQGGTNAGAVYIFKRTGTNWTQEAKIPNPDPHKDDRFGWSVSIHSNTVIIGAHGDDQAATDAGAAYVYSRENQVWVYKRKIVASGAEAGAAFGDSVAIVDDYLAVGCAMESSSGAVYMYRRKGIFTEATKVVSGNPASNGLFGATMALTDCGLLVGAPGEGGVGAVYAYETCTTIPQPVTWWPVNGVAGTITAPAAYTNASGGVYPFLEWRIEEVGSAVNPITGITMDAPRDAVAVYMPPPRGIRIVLGQADNSDQDFLQGGFPSPPIDLDATSATGFPKELNDSWWTEQFFYFDLTNQQLDTDIMITMSPHWSDSTGSLEVAVDVWDGLIWEELDRVHLSVNLDGLVLLPLTRLLEGRNDLRFRTVAGTNGTHALTWDQIILESREFEETVDIVVGVADESDGDFKQTGFLPQAINLDTQTSADFPKELNDSWWPQQFFYFFMNSAQASTSVTVTLLPYWSDGTGTLTVAIEVWGGTNWIEVDRADLNATVGGLLGVSTSYLAIGRNDFRLNAVSGNDGTHSLTWDQIVIRSGDPTTMDSDGDGIPDEWELQHGLNPMQADSYGDMDGDGLSNYGEYMAGTDPTDPMSVFSVDASVTAGPDRCVITWNSTENRTYDIWHATNLAMPFVIVVTNLPATPPVNVYTDDAPGECIYYRIAVE